MSVLQPMWQSPEEPAVTATAIKGWKNKCEAEAARNARSRSPRNRKSGVKSMLKAWAQGESSAVAIWRICHAIVVEDGSGCGRGMSRLAHLGTQRSGSQRNCQHELMQLLAETALPKMVQSVPHERGEKTITHHLRPSDVIRLIHKHNRRKFGQIFGANRTDLIWFWEGLFATDPGREFKSLHPILVTKSPEELQTYIPIIIHEDAAPIRKKEISHGPPVGGAHDSRE